MYSLILVIGQSFLNLCKIIADQKDSPGGEKT